MAPPPARSVRLASGSNTRRGGSWSPILRRLWPSKTLHPFAKNVTKRYISQISSRALSAAIRKGSAISAVTCKPLIAVELWMHIDVLFAPSPPRRSGVRTAYPDQGNERVSAPSRSEEHTSELQSHSF